MKLSQIVVYRQKLEHLRENFFVGTGKKTREELFRELGKISHSFLDLDQKFNQLDNEFVETINREIQLLIDQHRHLEKQCLTDSANYFGPMIESAEFITNTRWKLSPQTQQLIVNKIRSHSDWIFPGLIFRPSALDDIRPMVSCNPLYLVDVNQDILNETMKNYPIEFQQRLRPYVIDQNKENFLSILPFENFGLIVAPYYFNFRDLPTVEKYLAEIFKLLKPGGICSFSFNDCDHSHETKMAENLVNSYIPGSMLKSKIFNMGYHIIFARRDITGISWWEIQKPGKISSVRGGQPLAKIIAKSR